MYNWIHLKKAASCMIGIRGNICIDGSWYIIYIIWMSYSTLYAFADSFTGVFIYLFYYMSQRCVYSIITCVLYLWWAMSNDINIHIFSSRIFFLIVWWFACLYLILELPGGGLVCKWRGFDSFLLFYTPAMPMLLSVNHHAFFHLSIFILLK